MLHRDGAGETADSCITKGQSRAPASPGGKEQYLNPGFRVGYNKSGGLIRSVGHGRCRQHPRSEGRFGELDRLFRQPLTFRGKRLRFKRQHELSQRSPELSAIGCISHTGKSGMEPSPGAHPLSRRERGNSTGALRVGKALTPRTILVSIHFAIR